MYILKDKKSGMFFVSWHIAGITWTGTGLPEMAKSFNDEEECKETIKLFKSPETWEYGPMESYL